VLKRLQGIKKIYTEADDWQVSTICVFRYCNKIRSPGTVF